MSFESKEWLSVASDNHQIEAEQLDQLLSDAESQATWLRYQTAGQVLRQELPQSLQLDFADNFATLLDAEPEHQLTAEPLPQLATVTTSSVTPASATANQSWWKWAMQGAMAAGVAMIAVIGVQHQQQPDANLTTPLPVLQTSPIGGVAAPVSLNQTSVQPAYTPQQMQVQLEQQRRMQELLQARQQQIRLMEQAAAQAAEPQAGANEEPEKNHP